MKLKRIFSFFISCLLLLLISFESYAAVRSSSNAVMALSLDDDYGISLYSSLGTVTNTVKGAVDYKVFYYDADGNYTYQTRQAVLSNGRFTFSYSVDPGCYIRGVEVIVNKSALPVAGGYTVAFDMSSHFSYDITTFYMQSRKDTLNAASLTEKINGVPYDFSSGDIYMAPYEINLTNVAYLLFRFNIDGTEQRNIGGTFAVNFTPAVVSSNAPSTAGTNTTSDEAQIEISNNTTQILNTSNSIYESLQYLIQHISNQLAALWDQMYNLMHVPTMAKLDEILSALRAIANNSDIYAVVEEIDSSSREQTNQIVQNANENTSKVEQAVEKHGNFIIDGLKGLFIPSDEYFKSYFDELYNFFSDRFGFLSFPIDLLQRLADLF